jgi:hypothetical protein
VRRPAALLLTLTAACGSSRSNLPSAADSLFRAELLARVAVDQAVRDSFSLEMQQTGTLSDTLVVHMHALDSANGTWLGQRLRAQGLPTRARVGSDGVKAALLLIQHADWNPAFQAEMLPLVEQAFQAGEVEGQELAMLTDRVLKTQGRPQRYGTQMTSLDGVVRIDPIEDSAGAMPTARRLASCRWPSTSASSTHSLASDRDTPPHGSRPPFIRGC